MGLRPADARGDQGGDGGGTAMRGAAGQVRVVAVTDPAGKVNMLASACGNDGACQGWRGLGAGHRVARRRRWRPDGGGSRPRDDVPIRADPWPPATSVNLRTAPHARSTCHHDQHLSAATARHRAARNAPPPTTEANTWRDEGSIGARRCGMRGLGETDTEWLFCCRSPRTNPEALPAGFRCRGRPGPQGR